MQGSSSTGRKWCSLILILLRFILQNITSLTFRWCNFYLTPTWLVSWILSSASSSSPTSESSGLKETGFHTKQLQKYTWLECLPELAPPLRLHFWVSAQVHFLLPSSEDLFYPTRPSIRSPWAQWVAFLPTTLQPFFSCTSWPCAQSVTHARTRMIKFLLPNTRNRYGWDRE